MKQLTGLLILALGLAVAGCGSSEPPPRVILLGLDGVDPDVVDLMVAEGKLPNFARIKRDGAYARLRSAPPLLSPIIWTTIATGRKPTEHGIGHFTTVDPETGEELPVTSAMRRVRALWNIFSENERQVGVVGWWATWPAEPVNGVIVSDHTAYHFLMGQKVTDAAPDTGVIYPAEALGELSSMVRRPEDIGFEDLSRFVDVESDDLSKAFEFNDDLSHFRWALGAAQTYRDIGLHVWRERKPDLLLVYVEGVDTASHLFGHLYRRGDLAGELSQQQRRYGETVERMYELADSIVGDYLEVLDERSTLVVVSDHGFTLGELPADPSKTRDMRRVSEASHREHGILFMYGRGVAPGTRIVDADTIDITPTVLALAGLPVAQDMSGEILGENLAASAMRIATYEVPRADDGSGAGPRDAGVDSAVLEHLQSLGYIGSETSSSNDRNLANILLREGRYEEAAEAFADLIEKNPGKANLHSALGTAMSELGRTDEAFEHFALALEIDPLLSPAHHNRGLLLERLGRIDEAVEEYRTALRYRSEYEPARRALERLGVGSVGREPETEQEIRAAGLLGQAIDLQRRGDYDGAAARIDEARALAPDVAAVYQAEANVAYLRGDVERAIAALERALELEPDNALFAENLRRLREGD